MSSSLSIDVDALAGCDVHDVCRDMVELADKLGVSVRADLNGVRTVARPGVKHEALYEAWSEQISSKRSYKMAIV